MTPSDRVTTVLMGLISAALVVVLCLLAYLTRQQAIALRDAMRVLFPEAVALVSAARQGFMRQ